MLNEQARTHPWGRGAIAIAVGMALFALIANARDIYKYLRLVSMSSGGPPKH